MEHMTLDDFEDRYRANPDPWSYHTSAYERAKYDATLDACGPGPYRSALELGSSIGVLSARLAPRCQALTCIDGAATAVQTARARLAGTPGVEILLGAIPDVIPDGRFDLVLASEILYYLQPEALTATLARLEQVTGPGMRLVAVHWRPAGPERPFTARDVHERLRATPWLQSCRQDATDEYLLDVLRRP